ncbi:hypothetical protein MRB53_028142 [Persea americana]|uniref:Uncharacterized protein n=1 Tax=Persea americana TaxID=3435 RepID=A0ACC2KEW6_PERAE|nr:hypothetical protein MRB53_028142 [Persea americana]
MLVGPDDPRWQGGLFPFIRTPVLLICSFGTGPDDPRGVPPGSRFDPIGPPNVPRFELERFIRCSHAAEEVFPKGEEEGITNPPWITHSSSNFWNING